MSGQIARTDLPDGQFRKNAVHPFAKKYFALQISKIRSMVGADPPRRVVELAAIRDSHGFLSDQGLVISD